MADGTDFDDIDEDRLREAFKEASFPPTPRLESLVRRRLGRRRFAIRGGAVAAALVAVVWAVDWGRSRSPLEQVAQLPQSQSTNERTIEMADLPMLLASPPVDSLDLLAHQQADFVTALEQLEKE